MIVLMWKYSSVVSCLKRDQIWRHKLTGGPLRFHFSSIEMLLCDMWECCMFFFLCLYKLHLLSECKHVIREQIDISQLLCILLSEETAFLSVTVAYTSHSLKSKNIGSLKTSNSKYFSSYVILVASEELLLLSLI